MDTKIRIPTQERAKQRQKQILAAAVKLSEQKGYTNITRTQIAKLANCAEGSVNEYFGSMDQMRDAVVLFAKATKNLRILLQATVDGHPLVKRLPKDLKEEVRASI